MFVIQYLGYELKIQTTVYLSELGFLHLKIGENAFTKFIFV